MRVSVNKLCNALSSPLCLSVIGADCRTLSLVGSRVTVAQRGEMTTEDLSREIKEKRVGIRGDDLSGFLCQSRYI